MINENAPAFPVAVNYEYYAGLTKIECFAALALQGIMANPEAHPELEQQAWQAVMAAKALIKELEGLK